MAFPTAAGVVTSHQDSSVTSHPVSLPTSIASGETIVVCITGGTSSTWSWPTGGGADWVKIADFEITTGEQESMSIGVLKAAGGETSVTVTSSVATRSAAIAYRINTAADPTVDVPEINTVSGGGSPECNPPRLPAAGDLPDGAKDYLFIAFAGSANGGTFTAAPTNYNNLQTVNTGGTTSSHTACGSAVRQLNAANEDPAAFTHDDASTRDWCAATIAIYPASASTPISGSDTASVGITEGTSTIAGSSSQTDTPTISLSESVAIAGSSSQSDSPTVSISESVALVASSEQTDTLALSVTDAAQVVVVEFIAASDTATLSLVETAEIVVSISSTDSLSVGITDTLSVLDVSLSVADNASLSIAETVILASETTTTDILSISVVDTSNVDTGSGEKSASDALTVGITEDVPIIQATSEQIDSIAVAISESVSVAGTGNLSDAVTVSITETIEIIVPFEYSDVLTVSLTETAVIVPTTVNEIKVPLTLYPRSTAMTLHERNIDLTLEQRSVTMSLSELEL